MEVGVLISGRQYDSEAVTVGVGRCTVASEPFGGSENKTKNGTFQSAVSVSLAHTKSSYFKEPLPCAFQPNQDAINSYHSTCYVLPSWCLVIFFPLNYEIKFL